MFTKLIFLFIALTMYSPMYGQGISIRQKIKELQKDPLAHIIYDSQLNLDAPAGTVKWVKKGNNIILVPQKKESTHKSYEKKKIKRYTISGYVREENDEPLINATVIDKTSQSATMTNEHGFFSLTLPEGKHYIEVSFLGLGKVHKDISLEKDQCLQFCLHEDNTLEEVVVSADMNSPLLNTQMGKRSFTQADFNKGFSFMSSPDVVKLLQQMSGTASGIELASVFTYMVGKAMRTFSCSMTRPYIR